jgi:hypothetical protein
LSEEPRHTIPRNGEARDNYEVFVKNACTSLSGEAMASSQNSKEAEKFPDYPQVNDKKEERRTKPRVVTVLSRIEDATYEVLRKHEKPA